MAFNWFGLRQNPQTQKQGGTDPQFADEIAKYVEDEYQRRQAERKPFELQWRLNTEFLNGNQYLEIDPATQAIQEIPKLFWYQEREVFNQISTIHETRVARLTRQKPIMKVRPASGDDGDVSAAKVSSMLLMSAWQEQDMDSSYNDMVSWLEVQGTVLLKPTWDKNGGRVISRQPVPDQADPNNAPDTGAGVNTLKQEEINTSAVDDQLGIDQPMVTISEGDIDTAIVPAHEFFPDSSFRDGLHLCRSVIHARAYHVDEIKEMWGVDVEPEEVDVMTLQRMSSNMGGIGYSATALRSTITRLKNHSVLKEYYEMPCTKYPQGRFIVVAGKKTLHVGAMPYMIGADGEPEFPFIRIVSVHKPGVFWGGTIIERCIPIQRRYNALRNRKAEYLNLVAIGQWYEPEGSIDDDTELNNSPGNRIRYRPGAGGAKPEPVTYPSLPASFENEERSLLSEFTSISGVSELSRYSQAPSGVKSGVALSIANEQDDTRVGVTASRIANAITTLGKYWIRMYRQFVQEPRVLRSVGVNREVEVREWEASQLTSDDVLIENIAALSETPAQRRQMVFDLIGTGIFNRPETNPFSDEAKQKVFQLIEMGHWESGAEDDTALQKSRARRENQHIMSGQPAQVMDFDDDQIHIEQHNRERMQAEYDQMMRDPMVGPIVDKMMRDHVGMHLQRQMQRQMQELQLANQQAMQQETAKQAAKQAAAPPATKK